MSTSAQFAALKDATMGAQLQEAPASPITDNPAISGFYNSDRAVDNVRAAGNSTAQLSSQVAVANAQEAQAKVQTERDMLDGSKYMQIPKNDGGYTFLAPNGQEVSAYDYARITGKSLDSVLKDSQNPIDTGFVQDYNNLQDYIKAWVNHDQKTIDAIQSENPELKTFQDPGQLINMFRQHYPTVFGGKQDGHQSVSSTYVPNSGSVESNANYSLETGGSQIGT